MQKKTIVIDDVDKFPGLIACDSGSRSEIVIPSKKMKKFIAFWIWIAIPTLHLVLLIKNI